MSSTFMSIVVKIQWIISVDHGVTSFWKRPVIFQNTSLKLSRLLLHPKKPSTKRGRSSTDCQEIMGSIKNHSRWGLVPAINMKLQKKVDMSDGERTVQTWRPNPLPSANQGSNVKSSYINRHTDPQQGKNRRYLCSFVFGLLTDGECPNDPNGHGHMQHMFSSCSSDGQGFQIFQSLSLATSGATAGSLGPSSSCAVSTFRKRNKTLQLWPMMPRSKENHDF